MECLLLATDQPFWRRNSGALQRTWSVHEYLVSRGGRVVVFYLGTLGDGDLAACREAGVELVRFTPPPAGPISRTLRGLRVLATGRRHPAPAGPLTLASYRWPDATRQFEGLVARLQPSVVVCDYVVWASLLEPFPRGRRPFRAIVNTHDLLHARAAAFHRRGEEHWLQIDRAEEAAALRAFDGVLAIQPDEAETMRRMAPDAQVLVAGHCPPLAASTAAAEPAAATRANAFGFLGSANRPNADGIQWFLEACWPQIRRSSGWRLLIAGAVADQIQASDAAGVELLGPVDDLAGFYRRIDVFVNPVRFGSGLKIKTIEAVAAGKPVVAHTHSAAGVSPRMRQVIDEADTAEELIKACKRLAAGDALRAERAVLATEVANEHLRPARVYEELGRWLEEAARASEDQASVIQA